MLSALVFCSVIINFVFVSIDICFEQLLILLLLVFISVLRTYSFVFFPQQSLICILSPLMYVFSIYSFLSLLNIDISLFLFSSDSFACS